MDEARVEELRHELGRYQKKAADQAREIAGLREELSQVYAGSLEAQRGMDAVLIQTAARYGEEIKDEVTGEKLGYRLKLPVPNVEEIHARYGICARRDEETMEYIIGVTLRAGA